MPGGIIHMWPVVARRAAWTAAWTVGQPRRSVNGRGRRQGQEASRRVVCEPRGQRTTGFVPSLEGWWKTTSLMTLVVVLLSQYKKAAGSVKRTDISIAKYLKGKLLTTSKIRRAGMEFSL